MPAAPLTDEQRQEVIDLIEECLLEGYAPPRAPVRGKQAISEAMKRAVERGIVRSAGAFNSRLHNCRLHGMDPDWSLYRPPQYQKPVNTLRAPAAPLECHEQDVVIPEGEIHRVVAIGDLHDDPRLPNKERFTWLGRMISDLDPDSVVQIGDWSTFDSVSRHEDRSTIKGRALPSFSQDVDSLDLSLAAFADGLGSWSGKKRITFGNHEDRVRIYENVHPVNEGDMYARVIHSFRKFDWQWKPFGEYLFVAGVGFIHVPLNMLGRPYNGKTVNAIGNEAAFSVVFGHSHKGGVHPFPKIGPNQAIKVLNLGCALPWGHVEDYAKLAMTGWDYGAWELSLLDGMILSWRFWSMLEIANRYG